jgi:hypothetical protein
MAMRSENNDCQVNSLQISGLAQLLTDQVAVLTVPAPKKMLKKIFGIKRDLIRLLQKDLDICLCDFFRGWDLLETKGEYSKIRGKETTRLIPE